MEPTGHPRTAAQPPNPTIPLTCPPGEGIPDHLTEKTRDADAQRGRTNRGGCKSEPKPGGRPDNRTDDQTPREAPADASWSREDEQTATTANERRSGRPGAAGNSQAPHAPPRRSTQQAAAAYRTCRGCGNQTKPTGAKHDTPTRPPPKQPK